jgi:signal transduction histidine kinase
VGAAAQRGSGGTDVQAAAVSPRVPARYLLASLALLVALVGVHAVSSARRTQAELRTQLTDRGLALAEAFEASSRNAIRSNALVEEMVAERLFDNARLVDEMLRRPLPPGELEEIAKRNGLSRIDLLDLDGRPWTPAALPRMRVGPSSELRPGPMHAPPGSRRNRMMGPMSGSRRGTEAGGGAGDTGPRNPREPEGTGVAAPGAGAPSPAPGMHARPPDAPMMRFMWGRRWGHPGESADRAPSTIQDRKFWEGTVFGVATGATSFPGIIAVHADAETILSFRREIGVERQVEELGRQAGVTAVALLGPDLTVLVHSDPALTGTRPDDPALRRALAQRQPTGRLVERGGAGSVLEVVRPLALDGERAGLLAIEFSTEPMERAWQRDLRAGAALAAAVLAVGMVGLGAIFWGQQRHLRELAVLEAEVERRERLAAIGDVAAAFAHEVRNPLNAVSMGLQRLGAEFSPEPADEYGRFVGVMQGEVRRLNAIVEQFIALARPLPLEPARFAIGELFAELRVLLEPPARGAGVTLSIEAPGPGTIVADRDHLKQVLLNLVLNALQAVPGGGRVMVGAERTREAMVLTVADTGPGIPPEVLARVFDPYFTTKRGGLGLGLTIARRIVDAHGGTIEVESQPGRGTRVRVRLPERGS